MGSNENFPPPPPPGSQPPSPGNWPPQPSYQPTQQVPTTQQFPQQGYVPAAAPAPKKNNGLLIGGGLVVVAALVGGGILLMGGDDDKKPSVTLAPITSTTDATATTASSPVITDAPTTVPVATDAPTTVPESTLEEFFDDTGTFSMVLPNDLEIDTTVLVDQNGQEIPSIAAAESLAGYNSDDTTFGLTAVVVGPAFNTDAALVMDFLEPAEGTCTTRVADQVQTALGLADRVSLAGCGVGSGNKILMTVTLADGVTVVGLYMQGLADATTLAPAAQYALESVFVF